MLIEVHPVSEWQANCYLVAAGEDTHSGPRPCVVVDPGIMSLEVIEETVARRGWQPAAVLVTHGHLDHSGDAHKVASLWDVPVHCALQDQPMLTQPSLGLGQSFIGIIEQFLGADALPAPSVVHGLGQPFALAGLSVRPFHAPGHTAGSTLLEVSDATSTVVFTGDVLFAGTIGRTDLPSGNMDEMRRVCGGSTTRSRATCRSFRDTAPEPRWPKNWSTIRSCTTTPEETRLTDGTPQADLRFPRVPARWPHGRTAGGGHHRYDRRAARPGIHRDPRRRTVGAVDPQG